MSYPRTFGVTNGGVIHVADATYPNTADTRCGGVGVPMDKFYHHQDGIGALPLGLTSRCAGCFDDPAPAASGDRCMRETCEADGPACRHRIEAAASGDGDLELLRSLEFNLRAMLKGNAESWRWEQCRADLARLDAARRGTSK